MCAEYRANGLLSHGIVEKGGLESPFSTIQAYALMTLKKPLQRLVSYDPGFFLYA